MKSPNYGSPLNDTDPSRKTEQNKQRGKESGLKTAIKAILTVVLAILVFFGMQLAVIEGYKYVSLIDMALDGLIELPLDVASPEYVEAMQQIVDKINANSVQISLVSNLLVILVLCAGFTLRKKSPVEGMDIKSVSPMRYVGIALFGMALQVFIAVTMAFIPIPDAVIESHNTHYDILTTENMALELLSVGVVTGIVEELVFRGIGTKQLKRFMHPTLAVIISALIFGLMHPTVLSMIYATVIGLILGALYVKYDSVVPSIICHVFFNSASSLLALIPEDAAILLLVFYVMSIPLLIYLTRNLFFRYPTVSDLLFDDNGRIKPRNRREAAVIAQMKALKESGEITENDYKRIEAAWNEAKKPLPPQAEVKEVKTTEPTPDNDEQNKGDSNTDEAL